MYSHLHVLMFLLKMTIDGAARWHATTLRLQKKVVGVKFATFNWMEKFCALRAPQFLRISITYRALKGMEIRWFMFSHHCKIGQKIFLPGS